MAKGGKLMKLKSVLKKLNSFNKQNGSGGGSCRPGMSSAVAADADDSSANYSGDLHPVYVGKSRRRYLVSSDIIYHPLFKELAERSSDSSDAVHVSCEVVLFEHLLWMLENADPQPESLDELVEFYAC